MSLGRREPPSADADYKPPQNGPPCARCGVKTATEKCWRNEVFGHPLCRKCFSDYCAAPDRPKRAGLEAAMQMGPVELAKLFEAENFEHVAWMAEWVKRRDA